MADIFGAAASSSPWTAALSFGANMLGGAGGQPAPLPPDYTAVTVGGFSVPPYPFGADDSGQSIMWRSMQGGGGLNLSDPQTAVIIGVGVLLFGALMLAAVKR